jgi:beta-xylosidase
MLRSRIVIALLCLGVVAAAGPFAVGPAGARPTPVGQDPIYPGQVYNGDFPDPWILRVGQRYIAYSTTSYGLNLPTLTSTDLRTWIARPETADAPKGDGLPRVPAWAELRSSQPTDGRLRPVTGPWAPSVTRIGRHRFVLAYAVEVAGPGTRMCVSLATSTSPIGPFVDRSIRPTVCPRRGAIDPQVYVAPTGRPWLVWKADLYPAKLFTAPMNMAATHLRPGRPRRLLAKVSQPWEGSIIENPAMIRFKKRYYLFYSANSYASTRYATSYLICKSWKGDCRKPRQRPLLATGGTIAGPGGPAPFVNTFGRLRLGYHAWTVGKVGYPTSDACQNEPGGCGQRRLYIAKLRVNDRGRLKIISRY